MKFKSDKYKSARGRSQLLDISCRKCENHIAYYQKDGSGALRRMYIAELKKQGFTLVTVSDVLRQPLKPGVSYRHR